MPYRLMQVLVVGLAVGLGILGAPSAMADEASATPPDGQARHSQDVGGELERLRQLRRQHPEQFQQEVAQRKEQLRQELRRLKDTQPEQYTVVMERIRQQRRQRLEQLRQEHPERYRSLMQERQQRLQQRLQHLQQEDPERYERVKQRLLQRRQDSLEQLHEQDPARHQRFLERHPRWTEQIGTQADSGTPVSGAASPERLKRAERSPGLRQGQAESRPGPVRRPRGGPPE